MKYIEGKSKRERLLIIGLIVSVIFGIYVITRVSDLNSELVKLEKNYKAEKNRLAKLNRETGNAKPSSKIEKQVKKMHKKLKTERENLQAFDFKFVDLSNEEALLEQITRITITAENNQLRILSKRNELRPLTSMMGNLSSQKLKAKNTALKNRIGTSQLQRRMYRLKLRGTFKSTYDFIKELQKLEHGVLITRLNMTADDKNTYNGLRLIITDITLAI